MKLKTFEKEIKEIKHEDAYLQNVLTTKIYNYADGAAFFRNDEKINIETKLEELLSIIEKNDIDYEFSAGNLIIETEEEEEKFRGVEMLNIDGTRFGDVYNYEEILNFIKMSNFFACIDRRNLKEK